MFPPKKILFPVDFSERCDSAARMVETFTGHFEAELTLAYVLEPRTYNDIIVDAAGVSEQQLGAYLADELKQFEVRRVMLDGDVHQLAGAGQLRRCSGVWIAQHLARHPILAISAVEIAAQHAEGESVSAGHAVEEGFFLDRIARQHADIAEGDFQNAVVVEPDAADAVAAGFDQAAMSAGEAADGAVGFVLDQRFGGGGDVLMQHVLERFEAGFVVEDLQWRHDWTFASNSRLLRCRETA